MTQPIHPSDSPIEAGWTLRKGGEDGHVAHWRHRALAPAPHGFFTRTGGVSGTVSGRVSGRVSGGLYSSLNCGTGSQDAPDNIRQNRARAAAALGLAPDRLVGLKQVHGSGVITLTDEEQLKQALHSPPAADGLVSIMASVGLAILTADCAPVLMRDGLSGIIGACHAGWRGAVSGVVQETVKKMEELGAVRGAIHLAIGPTIAQDSYQIGAEMIAMLQADHPDAGRFIAPNPDGSGQFDLPGYLAALAGDMGLASIQTLGADTYQDEAHYFSHRRATHRQEPDSGRLISIIGRA